MGLGGRGRAAPRSGARSAVPSGSWRASLPAGRRLRYPVPVHGDSPHARGGGGSSVATQHRAGASRTCGPLHGRALGQWIVPRCGESSVRAQPRGGRGGRHRVRRGAHAAGSRATVSLRPGRAARDLVGARPVPGRGRHPAHAGRAARLRGVLRPVLRDPEEHHQPHARRCGLGAEPGCLLRLFRRGRRAAERLLLVRPGHLAHHLVELPRLFRCRRVWPELGAVRVAARRPGHALQRPLSVHARLLPRPRFLWVQWWHHDGKPGGPETHATSLWSLLYQSGVDVVVNANAHNYERWAPQNLDGRLDPKHGITEFVVGTGGKRLIPFGPEPEPRHLVAVRTTRSAPCGWSWAPRHSAIRGAPRPNNRPSTTTAR